MWFDDFASAVAGSVEGTIANVQEHDLGNAIPSFVGGVAGDVGCAMDEFGNGIGGSVEGTIANVQERDLGNAITAFIGEVSSDVVHSLPELLEAAVHGAKITVEAALQFAQDNPVLVAFTCTCIVLTIVSAVLGPGNVIAIPLSLLGFGQAGPVAGKLCGGFGLEHIERGS